MAQALPVNIMEVNFSGKHSSLLKYVNNYGGIKIYSTSVLFWITSLKVDKYCLSVCLSVYRDQNVISILGSNCPTVGISVRLKHSSFLSSADVIYVKIGAYQ